MYKESIGETKEKFMREIEEVMERIALDVFNGEKFMETYIHDLEEPRNFFYRSMKGTIPVIPEDIEELVMNEVNRQEAFNSTIMKLAEKINEGKVIPPNQIVAYPYWEHTPSFGCNIRSGSTFLYAYPRLPSSTEHFLTLKQAPVPANVIHVNENYILMLPYGQDLSEDLRNNFSELIGRGKTIQVDEIDDQIRVHEKFFSLVTEERVSKKTLDTILKEYDGLAIQVGNKSNNTAYIHTGLEEGLPKLWRTIYFDWKGNWRRHQ